jgi:iron only hydrogenase large subunit-like protein
MSTPAVHERPAEARGDIPALLKSLKSGGNITLLAAPAAWTVLPELPRIFGFFQSLGVRAVVPVLPYADISAWVYYRLLAENPNGSFISSACVGMNRYIAAQHPAIAPARRVYSPLLAAARCLKTYCGVTDAFAFLSPCTQKCLEFSVRGETLIHYNITIAALSAWLASAGIDLCQYPPASAAVHQAAGTGDFNLGLTVAAFGSICGALARVYPHLESRIIRGAGRAGQFLAEDFSRQSRPFFFEPYACPGGCANGSGIGKAAAPVSPDAEENPRNKGTDTASILELFRRFDAELDVNDFLA